LGGGSRQQAAQRTAARPAQAQAKQTNEQSNATNRGRLDVAYAPLKSPSAPKQLQTPNEPIELGKRVALVIGNGAYQQVPALLNPPRDSTDIAEVLTRLGFSVLLANDLNLEQTKDAITQFGKVVSDSDIALVFYAGQGIEAYGENWFIPIDAKIRDDGDMRSEAINLKNLSSEVAKSKSLGLIILDACRDNPFTPAKVQAVATTMSGVVAETQQTSRSVKKGLAPTEPSGNVLIAFAAKDGTTASDGGGRNSPFTSSLLKHIETPGLEVSFLFRRVRDDVMSATNGVQQPYIYGSLSRTEIFLKPTAATGSANTIH